MTLRYTGQWAKQHSTGVSWVRACVLTSVTVNIVCNEIALCCQQFASLVTCLALGVSPSDNTCLEELYPVSTMTFSTTHLSSPVSPEKAWTRFSSLRRAISCLRSAVWPSAAGTHWCLFLHVCPARLLGKPPPHQAGVYVSTYENISPHKKRESPASPQLCSEALAREPSDLLRFEDMGSYAQERYGVRPSRELSFAAVTWGNKRIM